MGIKSSIEFWYPRSAKTIATTGWQLSLKFPLPIPYVRPGSIKIDYVKMAASCWSRRRLYDRKVGDLHAARISLTVVVQAWFVIYQSNLEPSIDNPFQQLSWNYPRMMTCCVSVKGCHGKGSRCFISIYNKMRMCYVRVKKNPFVFKACRTQHDAASLGWLVE